MLLKACKATPSALQVKDTHIVSDVQLSMMYVVYAFRESERDPFSQPAGELSDVVPAGLHCCKHGAISSDEHIY